MRQTAGRRSLPRSGLRCEGSSIPLWGPQRGLAQMATSFSQADSPTVSEIALKPSQRVASGSWNRLAFQREFLERVGKDLGIKQLSDWYPITRKEVYHRGGSPLFIRFNSLEHALRTLYPTYPWQSLRFLESGKARNGFWDDPDNVRSAIDKAEQRLGLEKPEDWYTVNLTDARAIGFPNSISRVKLAEILSHKYPTHNWEKVYLLRGRYAQQKRLEKAVRSLFSDVEVKINARKAAQLTNTESWDYFELDIFIPSMGLAFEFQERHHYTTTEYSYVPVEMIQKRDQTKKEQALEKGITLVIIPFWWDGTLASLVATIKKARPDLLPNWSIQADPIPEEIPDHILNEGKIEDIGRPITPCFLVSSAIDPTGWWMFEKYDGLRGFWNPIKRAFYSRTGNQFSLPKEVIDSMPDDIFLDGELWFGRENFQEAMKVSNRIDANEIDWSKFKYMVFDIPRGVEGSYSDRYRKIEEYFGKRPPPKFMEVANPEVCKDMPHLEKYFQDIVDRGGEGLILRDPQSPLQAGRSPGYLKHKKFRDAEAKVVSRVGAHQWECELPNGVKFTAAAGTTEFTERWNPREGDIVSFKHHGYLLASKKPKFPTLYRLRQDLTWDDVVQNWKEQKISLRGRPIQKSARETPRKPKYYWKDPAHRRQFFCDVANDLGFDPKVPENWDKITLSRVISKRGKGPLLHYDYVLKEALMGSFPEIDWTRADLAPVKKNNWQDIKNCREFFDDFAKEKGIDPLNAQGWYSVDLTELQKKKGGHRLKRNYGGFKRALQKAYPEVEFFGWPNVPAKESKWDKATNCRRFFDSYAQEHGFDPLRWENWMALPLKQLSHKKGGYALLGVHKSWKRALRFAYPDAWEAKR